MRHSNHADRGRRLPSWAVGVIALVVVGCGSAAAPSASPTVAPTPVVTPDPHLKEPVTADQIYTVLAAAKLGVVPSNANLGHGNPLVVKQINAELGNWPLRITQYRSAADLKTALAWKSGVAPGSEEAPYAFAGLNILIQFGPIGARVPSAPDAGRQQAASSVIAVLDPLLWPLAQRSVIALPSRTAAPASAAPSASPSGKPAASSKSSVSSPP